MTTCHTPIESPLLRKVAANLADTEKNIPKPPQTFKTNVSFRTSPFAYEVHKPNVVPSNNFTYTIKQLSTTLKIAVLDQLVGYFREALSRIFFG